MSRIAEINRVHLSKNKKSFVFNIDGNSFLFYIKTKLIPEINFNNYNKLENSKLFYNIKDIEVFNGWVRVNSFNKLELESGKIVNFIIKKSTINEPPLKIKVSESDELNILEKELSEYDEMDTNNGVSKSVPKIFNFSEIYANDKKYFNKSPTELVTSSKNRKIQNLINGTLLNNYRSSYYRAPVRSRSLDYGEIIHFDNGTTSDFLYGQTDTLKLTSPKQLSMNEELLVGKIEKEYADFYSKKDFDLYELKKTNWEEFAKKINRKLIARFNIIKLLARTAMEFKKETGNWILYASWPFVEGICTKTKIRTPLMYTPIGIQNIGGNYLIHKTEQKIKINTQLIRAFYAEKQQVPTNLKINFETIEDVLREYKKHGIIFDNQLAKLKKMKIIKKDDFNPGIQINKFELVNMFLIENILQSEDVFNDSIGITRKYDNFVTPKINKDFKKEFDTSNYLLLPFDVDKNKNQVISASLDDSIVIHGPPGTGKSEVITSILVKSMSQGNNNIVVAEKDAALSVLVTRLKEKYGLDNFCLKLNGDALQKKIFWAKIKKTIAELRTLDNSKIKIYEYRNPYEKFYENYNTFINKMNDDKISYIDFWEQHGKLRELYSKIPLNHQSISENIDIIKNNYVEWMLKKQELNKLLTLKEEQEISNIKFFKKNLSHVEAINYTLTKTLDSMNNQIEKSNTTLNNQKLSYNSLLCPTLVYLPSTIIDRDIIIELQKNPRKLFKYLSNKHYSSFSIKKAFKENHVTQNKLVETLHKLIELEQKQEQKTLDIKIKDIKKQTKKELIEFNNEMNKLSKINNNKLKKINIDISQTKKIILKYEKLYLEKANIQEIKDITLIDNEKIIELEKIEKLYNDYYDSEFDDLHKKYEKSRKFLQTLFSNAKKSFKNMIIKKIWEKIDKSENSESLNNKLRSLDAYSNYSTKKQKNPGSIIRANFDIISILFPTIIATPNEVSRYIPQDPNIFDYGIFDESSQIFQSRALPSIHRSRKVIIAGDDKQLSPSKWFSAEMNDVSYDEDILDHESILLDADSLFTWGKSRYKQRLLTNHYRSTSAILIEYSNMQFYSGQLTVSDSPIADAQPIELHEVDGIWTNRTNEQEALLIINKLHKLIYEFESVGIVTMNINQKNYIEDAIEKDSILSRTNNNCNIFVRNIENVQGYEADVIIFSIGYAKTLEGKIRLGLAHLTPNRLNVAITRAKHKMIVFKSIKSQEIGLGSPNSGRNVLYKWVKWLEEKFTTTSKLQHKIYDHVNIFRSPFEEEFYDILKTKINNNFLIKTNYFVNGYELDIVLFDIIQKKYAAAIELDGDKYHSSSKQIAVDMTKIQFLESLGWNLVRVSSTSFFHNNKEECVLRTIGYLRLENILK